MKLMELAKTLHISRISGNAEVTIQGIAIDSRRVAPGDLFICLRGHQSDGHHYAQQALEKGAVALVVEEDVDVDCPKLFVKDSRYAMAVLSSHFYGYPSEELTLIGITGTNGKTTTAYFIEQIFRQANVPIGLLGTIEMKIGDRRYPVQNTTPDAIYLQQAFREMLDVGVKYCVMEVSSHALEMGRVLGCNFRTAVFTNLSQDHLDYHGSMEQYLRAKEKLFARMGNGFTRDEMKRKVAVINMDDPASSTMQQATTAETITYGFAPHADVRAENVQLGFQRTTFRLQSFRGSMDIELPMIGKFNVYNALAAIAVSLIEGIRLETIRDALQSLEGVPGRFEVVSDEQDYTVIVDFAHTPDGLENVLQTIQQLSTGRVITVFGCGGDRDREKRPLMGEVAARYSDQVIITSDNPRSESPEAIALDIERGLKRSGITSPKYSIVLDRKEAITKAVEMASPKDVVLIAGKGHETYQEINGIRYDFDDRFIARNAIRSRKN